MAIPREDHLAGLFRTPPIVALPARGIHREKQVEGEGVPTHASQHEGGDDPITPCGIGASADNHSHKASKSWEFEFPAEDLAVGDFKPESAIRIPASDKHGTITIGTVYVRCGTVGTGTNTILFRTSTTLTGSRTTQATIELGTDREASEPASSFDVTDGMYLWVECSAVGATAPKKVICQVDGEETTY